MSTNESEPDPLPIGQYHLTRDVDVPDDDPDAPDDDPDDVPVGGDVNELTGTTETPSEPAETSSKYVSEWRAYFEHVGFPDFVLAPFATAPLESTFPESVLNDLAMKSESHDAPSAIVPYSYPDCRATPPVKRAVLFGPVDSNEADRLSRFITYEVERCQLGYQDLLEPWIEWVQR